MGLDGRAILFILLTAAHIVLLSSARAEVPGWVEFLPMEESAVPEGYVFVKGGCFMMGNTFGDGGANETPPHGACVNDLYVKKHEVTRRLWRDVVGSDPTYLAECGECPVGNVSWRDVQRFITRLNERTGRNYRLPTEAEWEYAAKGGGERVRFAGTDSELEVGRYVWYKDNSGGRLHSVGLKKPNELGIYDMGGNVGEWVSDWYGKDFYSWTPRDNPKGPPEGEHRVVRGGSWMSTVLKVYTTYRGFAREGERDGTVGFRLVLPVVD